MVFSYLNLPRYISKKSFTRAEKKQNLVCKQSSSETPCWVRCEATKPVEEKPQPTKMSLYDGVDIDGVPMQSNSTEGTDLTKLCKELYCYINIICYLFQIGRVKSPLKAVCYGRI